MNGELTKTQKFTNFYLFILVILHFFNKKSFLRLFQLYIKNPPKKMCSNKWGLHMLLHRELYMPSSGYTMILRFFSIL